MRLLAFAFLGLVLATPAWAQDPNTASTPAAPIPPSVNGHIYASATCSQRIPCPDGSPMSSDQLIGIASACIKQHFGFDASNAFEGSYGINADNCLDVQASVRTNNGAGTYPKCCVMQLSDSSCTFHCDFTSAQ